jgi:hypothetical protein
VQLFKQCQVLVGRGELLLQAEAEVQGRMQVADQVEVSLRLQVPRMEATSVVLQERSQLVAPLELVVVELRMQVAAVAAFGAVAVELHTQVAVAVHRSLLQVRTESPTPPPWAMEMAQYEFGFLKQQQWLHPHSSQGRAGRDRANSPGWFHLLMM